MERDWRRLWVTGWAMFLAACAGTPERASTGRYAFDSASNSCRHRPELCVRAAGEEAVIPPVRPIQAMVSATRTAVAALRVLDSATQAIIEERLKECADQARSSVLIDKWAGRSPTPVECSAIVTDASSGRRLTLAMHLGCLIHRAALVCTHEALEELRPGRFSLEQRFRFDGDTGILQQISEGDARLLLRLGCGEELKGTLVPDVIIHEGDPLVASAVYDFKFPCVNTDRAPSWRRYEEGPHQGLDQQLLYERALGTRVVRRVVPRIGVVR
ncbi:hypothetical protein [Myxococcus eversor]|uniref:hypothetical protein n=1 Tax=Myxococcus eversor TaxID=2709661 RepID=UPI0013D57B93|nr:hypothetical protein [Myxococcus eversor]